MAKKLTDDMSGSDTVALDEPDPNAAEARLDPVTMKSFGLTPQYDSVQADINAKAMALADAMRAAQASGIRISAPFHINHLNDILVG